MPNSWIKLLVWVCSHPTYAPPQRDLASSQGRALATVLPPNLLDMRRADAFQPSLRASSEHCISIQRSLYAHCLNYISSLGLFPANICPPAKRPCVLQGRALATVLPPNLLDMRRTDAFRPSLRASSEHCISIQRSLYAQCLNYILNLGLFPANNFLKFWSHDEFVFSSIIIFNK